MLRGNQPARIDDKGRLKVPSAFRALIEEKYGKELFVTSLDGNSVRIYPMAEWQAIEARVLAMPSTHPARLRFLDRVNYYGQASELDAQGRVLIHPILRESAGIAGDVDVLGSLTHLDVWSHERFVPRIADPLSDEDLNALSAAGV
jgi:MraZ protein